ncbi:MAG: ykuE, partial [Chlamydiia bacterium]|nr:ykuE [Chlamydiia bacterium]
MERLWDLWCIASIIGIWPRFIEPNILVNSNHTLPITMLPKELNGLTIVQISDLHYSSYTRSTFLKRVSEN